MNPKEIDPEVSKYFSEMAKKRKNPYLPFKDRVKAKEASRLAQEKRDAQKKEPAQIQNNAEA
jgi:hypothetical protein